MMDMNPYGNDNLHIKMHAGQVNTNGTNDQPKRKKSTKKKTDIKQNSKQIQEPNEGLILDIPQDLNADLIHYTHRLEFELANTKKKLKFQRKKFRKLIQSLANYFDSKGITSKIIDEYIINISHQLGQDCESDDEYQKFIQNNSNNNANITTINNNNSSIKANHTNSNNVVNNKQENNLTNSQISNNTSNMGANSTNTNQNSSNNNAQKMAGTKNQKQTSNVIKLSLSGTDVGSNSDNMQNSNNTHIPNKGTPTNNNNNTSINSTGPAITKKNQTFSIEHEPKKRRTKKAKLNNEENPNMVRKSTINSQNSDERDLSNQSNTYHQYDGSISQQPKKPLSNQNSQYPNTKKYEEIAELAQKNHQDILKDLMYQNGLRDMQDIMKQVKTIDPNDILKYNIRGAANPTPNFGNHGLNGTDDWLTWMKVFQEGISLNQNILTNDAMTDLYNGFINNYPNK